MSGDDDDNIDAYYKGYYGAEGTNEAFDGVRGSFDGVRQYWYDVGKDEAERSKHKIIDACNLSVPQWYNSTYENVLSSESRCDSPYEGVSIGALNDETVAGLGYIVLFASAFWLYPIAFWLYPIAFLLTFISWFLLCYGLSFGIAAIDSLFFINSHYKIIPVAFHDIIRLLSIVGSLKNLDTKQTIYNWPGIVIGTIITFLLFLSLVGRERKWDKKKKYWFFRHIWRVLLPAVVLYFGANSINNHAYYSSSEYKNYELIEQIKRDKELKYSYPIDKAYSKNK